MSRGQILGPVDPTFKLVGERRWQHFGPKDTKASRTGAWSQEVEVEGQRYHVRVGQGRMVKIPYKPRGQNIGYRWYAEVYSVNPHGKVWDAEVGKSIGVRGILIYAGLVTDVWKEWAWWCETWGRVGRAERDRIEARGVTFAEQLAGIRIDGAAGMYVRRYGS